jgi:hypothetical protein
LDKWCKDVRSAGGGKKIEAGNDKRKKEGRGRKRRITIIVR